MKSFPQLVTEFNTYPYNQLAEVLEYNIGQLRADPTKEGQEQPHRVVMAVHCSLEPRLPGYLDELRRQRKTHPYRGHLQHAQTVLQALRNTLDAQNDETLLVADDTDLGQVVVAHTYHSDLTW